MAKDAPKTELEARVDRSSERSRAALQTATDIDERCTEVEAALMRHIRKLEAGSQRVEDQNAAQTKLLKSIQTWTPVLAAIAGAVAAVVSAIIHALH